MNKRIILSLLSLVLLLSVSAQNDSIKAPYLRFPTYPPVKLLLPDSVSYFTKQDLDKKKSVMVMLFNPQCEHCQQKTGELVKNIDEFKDIQIVMTTSMPFDSMMSFRKRYQLDQHKNIIVGQDVHYFLPSYYMIKHLPFLAFYNKKKELITAAGGAMTMEAILEIFKD
jgi:hypothetical protein